MAVTDKSPNYQNQLGFDADIVDASGILANGATSATITVTTVRRPIFPGPSSSSPNCSAASVGSKTVTDVNGGDVSPGDVLEYTVTVANAGVDGAPGRPGRPDPRQIDLRAGTLSITSGANSGAKTDASGNDQALFDAANDQVVFNLGTGATAAQGGTLAQNESTAIRFRVQVDDGTFDARIIVNRANVTFVPLTLGNEITINSNSTLSPVVNRADLRVTKTGPPTVALGQNITYTITVTNSGPLDATGVTLTDTLPIGVNLVSVSPSQGSFGGAPTITCNLGTIPSGGSATITVVVTPMAPGSLVNTVEVDGNQPDPDPRRQHLHIPDARHSHGRPVDHQVGVAESVRVNDTLTYTITVRNNGPSPATDVVLTETVPPGISLVSATLSQGSCTGTGPVGLSAREHGGQRHRDHHGRRARDRARRDRQHRDGPCQRGRHEPGEQRRYRGRYGQHSPTSASFNFHPRTSS